MAASEPESEKVALPHGERRVAERRYNRRPSSSEPTPPYYETFDRIALALERIEQHLGGSGG